MKGYIVIVKFNGEPTSFLFATKKQRDGFVKDVLRDFKNVTRKDIIYTTEKVEIKE